MLGLGLGVRVRVRFRVRCEPARKGAGLRAGLHAVSAIIYEVFIYEVSYTQG